jgi:hypothetical protein
LDKQNEIENRYKNVFSFRDFRFKNVDITNYCKRIWCDDNGMQKRYSQRVTCNDLESVHQVFMS